MRSIQKKLLLYIVVLGVIPMLFFTYYYYGITADKVVEKLNNESYNMLNILDNQLAAKISKLENTAGLLFDDSDFYEALWNVGSVQEEEERAVQSKLDEIYTTFSRNEHELKTLILFPVNGNVYISGEELSEKDPIRFVLKYDDVGSDMRGVSWLGLRENSDIEDSDVIVAGAMLYDIRNHRKQPYLGTVYMVFGKELFSDENVNQISYLPQEKNELLLKQETISIYDANAKLIYATGNQKLRNCFLERPINGGLAGYADSTGSFRTTVDTKDYMIIYHTSPATGWKMVRAVEQDAYFKELRSVGYKVLVFMLLMLGAWIICNQFVIKRITLPIRELTHAMQKIERDDFEVELKVRSRDEFGTIAVGFNAMVSHIKALLNQIRTEEEKRRQLDILMLRYQMNPHFLYNTLASIRLTAIMNQQDKIAEMLLILGRFLRNAILTVDTTLDVKSEISNIRDYISLYQLRYEEQLDVKINVEETCYDCQVLSMLCQPIIENAIMHGLSDKLSSGELAQIVIRVKEDRERLLITVYDNGNGMTEQKIEQVFAEPEKTSHAKAWGHLHIGLQNIQKRINLVYGQDYGIRIHSEEGVYTEVELRLPKIIKRPYN